MTVTTTHVAPIGDRLAVYAEAPVVRHGNWLNKVLQQVSAEERGLLLVTPPYSALSRGLLHLLDRTGALWLVEAEEDGTHYLGRSGDTAHLDDDGAVEILDDPHPCWLREGAAEDRGGILLQAETLMPRRAGTRAGGLTEAVFAAAIGGAPLGWGLQEPVTEPWDPEEITARVSRGEPLDVLLHVAGPDGEHRPAATTLIQRPRNGVVEHVSLAGERSAPMEAAELTALAHALHRQGVRWARVEHVVGADRTVVPPWWLGSPVPALLQLGPEALQGHDPSAVTGFAREAGAIAAEPLGSGPGTGLAVLFSASPDDAGEEGSHPLRAQEAVLAHLTGGAPAGGAAGR